MKDKKGNVEITKQQESGKSWFVANINTCISCGREIPEGMLSCLECEKGLDVSKCTICDKPLTEKEIALCTRCRATFLRPNNKDQ